MAEEKVPLHIRWRDEDESEDGIRLLKVGGEPEPRKPAIPEPSIPEPREAQAPRTPAPRKRR